ncbi:MAG: sulfatase-like hydrolase/transferase [Pirellulales bacterium]
MNRILPAFVLLVSIVLLPRPCAAADARLPNILWITCEDICPNLGCYGDANAVTPNLDRLAAEGLRYRTVWSNAPVCAPARTTIISGVYPTATGAEHMRSMVPMPTFMQMYPQLLRQRGYYCTNNAKEDYNLPKRGKVWDVSSGKGHWKNRKPGQPFFAVFNIETSHESQIRSRPHKLVHDPAKIRVPGYHPDTPEVRHDWTQYYDKITAMDARAGKLLAELTDAGLAEDTIVFFYGDNGCGMPRGKRWPYDSGLHVPMIVRIPAKFKHLAPKDYQPGGATDRLVGFVDLAPTLLSLAGLQPPDWMQGHAIMGRFATPAPPYLFGFRGRMDERYDLVRSVRNDRYVYIRNYMPHLIYGQYLDYMFQTPTTRVWKKLYDEGKLKPPQTFFWETKPAEELYDLATDRDEVKNLAGSPQHAAILQELRAAERKHAMEIRDVGFLSESEIHRRSAGTTPYEMGRDAAKYPLENILAMADAASMLRPEATPQLKQGLGDADSAVRYWAAMGLLMRGAAGVDAGRAELRRALADEAPSVRVVAARALGQYGNAEDLALALPALGELASPEKNGAYVSIETLNAVDALGEKAASLKPALAGMSGKDPAAPGRANGYVPRLLERILGDSQ